jgi:hypothetical protein
MGRYIPGSEDRKKCDGRKKGTSPDHPATAAQNMPVKRHLPHPILKDDSITIMVI